MGEVCFSTSALAWWLCNTCKEARFASSTRTSFHTSMLFLCSSGAINLGVPSWKALVYWNRVVAGASQGLTAGQPPQCQPAPSPRPEAQDCIIRVVRAGRGVTTRGRPVWRQCLLVQPDKTQHQVFHLNSFSLLEEACIMSALLRRSCTACQSPWKSAWAAGIRAMKTISHPPFRLVWRITSRSLRFTRFRTTAFPTWRLTESPTRLVGIPLGCIRSTTNWFARLPPWRRTTRNSAVFLRRRSRLRERCGDGWVGTTLSGSSKLYRQPYAALEAPSPQHLPTTPGVGPGAKAMNALPASFLGLVGSFGHT